MGIFGSKAKKNRFKRIFLVVLDSVGAGEAIDASRFGDTGAYTLKHVVEASNHEFKNLGKLGLFNLLNGTDLPTMSYYTKAHEISNGKDTLTGHLEMMGVITKVAFKTFTNEGHFPEELIKELEEKTGRKIIGNCVASGTEIIKDLGEEHMKTGNIIVYTSADSVLQIAAHEEVIPLEELYKICEIARNLTLSEKWKVGRIIARPFVGTPGNFTRTGNRKDYALNPAIPTVLDNLKNKKYSVIGIGKIADIFNGCGITSTTHTGDNIEGIRTIMKSLHEDFTGLCFANLNDFDSKYGHRRDVIGYGNALREFDEALPHMLAHLNNDDLLIITADHGNDPTFKGTDHTREDVPVFIYSSSLTNPKHLDELTSFADLGATIADNFNVKSPSGTSFLDKLK